MYIHSEITVVQNKKKKFYHLNHSGWKPQGISSTAFLPATRHPIISAKAQTPTMKSHGHLLTLSLLHQQLTLEEMGDSQYMALRGRYYQKYL